jgi:hypothetical protein
MVHIVLEINFGCHMKIAKLVNVSYALKDWITASML